MATFLEGVESITLWCSLVVLLPAVVLALVMRTNRVWLVGAAMAGTATMMWARAGRLWEFDSDGAQRWLIGAAIVTTFVVAFRQHHAPPALSVALGLVSGGIAGWLWQPCVGEQFAEILNGAESDRAISLIEMHLYVVGLSLPAILLAALPYAWPPAKVALNHRAVRSAGLGAALVYGATVAVGWYDDVVSELFRLSST